MVQECFLILPEDTTPIPRELAHVGLRVVHGHPIPRLHPHRRRGRRHAGTEESTRRIDDRARIHPLIMDGIDLILNVTDDLRERESVEAVREG